MMKPVQILVVEWLSEEIDNIKYVLDKLKLYYELSYASNAGDAVKVLTDRTLRKKIPELVLIAENLPDKSGRELIREIRMQKQWRQFACFLLVTKDNTDFSDAEKSEGISGCIKKPLSMSGHATAGFLNLAMDLLNKSVGKDFR